MQQAQTAFERYDLPFSESCWIFASNGVSLLKHTEGRVSYKQPDYGLLRELVQQGKIDTLHTWGDFPSGGFSRKLAAEGYSLLRGQIKFAAWTAHGGLKDLQNLSPLGQGDIADSEYYHMDYTEALGVRFFCRNIDIDVSRPSRHILLHSKYFKRFRGPTKREAASITLESLPRQIELAERKNMWHRPPDNVIIYTHFYALLDHGSPLGYRPAKQFTVSDATDDCLRQLAERRDKGEIEILRLSDLLNSILTARTRRTHVGC